MCRGFPPKGPNVRMSAKLRASVLYGEFHPPRDERKVISSQNPQKVAGPPKLSFSFGCRGTCGNCDGSQEIATGRNLSRNWQAKIVMHVAILEIPIKEGLMGEFCAFMKGEFGLHLTRGSVGCRTVRCSIKDDVFCIYEEWLTEKDQEAYMAMRNTPGHAGFENGVFAASRYAPHPCDTL